MKSCAAFLLAIIIAGCSTKPSNLQEKATPVVHLYSENYQEIFRRVSTNAKRCQSGNVGAYASLDVDAQLYPDLGYGDVSQSLVNMGVRNYYWTAKIEKTDTGSKMTLHAGNTLGAANLIRKAEGWAAGGESC